MTGNPSTHATSPRSLFAEPTWHRLVRRAVFAAMVFVVALAWLAARLDWRPPIPRGFRGAVFLIVGCNIIWWTLADQFLARALMRRASRRAARIALLLAVLLFAGPVAWAVLFSRLPSLAGTPLWYVSAWQLWHMGLLVGLPLITAAIYLVLLVASLIRAIRSRRRAAVDAAPPALSAAPPATLIPNSGTSPALPRPALSRRDLLAAAALGAPVILAGGLGLRGARRIGRFLVRKYDLPAPWLPQRLRGLTIAHVSDVHLGRFFRPAMLPPLIDAVNRLDADLLLFTGDLVDLSNDLLPPGIAALRAMSHRYGLFMCIGNHDLIDDGAEFVRTVRTEGLNLLLDERQSLDIGGEPLTIAGVQWSRRNRSRDAGPTHTAHVHQTLLGYRPTDDGPCIALAHHPHTFDALADAGVPLTLSGHTHGGQLMFAPPRDDGIGAPDRDRGAGEFLFRYLRGFYARLGSTLFVNSGVGDWFPVRYNAPAEIVRLRLV